MSPIFLLIDDDTDDTFLFNEVLQQVNPAVTFRSAANGQEALDTLKSTAALPDVIFLDLNMPRMDGRQCLSALKQDHRLKHIPVIIYTTSSHPLDIAQTLQNGAACFITKPTDTRALINILAAIAANVHSNLEDTLHTLRDDVTTFVTG
ncbi:response regulator [Chitinophaga japonensis]|nr:response regulator [Chitinophaga japonensis]